MGFSVEERERAELSVDWMLEMEELAKEMVSESFLDWSSCERIRACIWVSASASLRVKLSEKREISERDERDWNFFSTRCLAEAWASSEELGSDWGGGEVMEWSYGLFTEDWNNYLTTHMS